MDDEAIERLSALLKRAEQEGKLNEYFESNDFQKAVKDEIQGQSSIEWALSALSYLGELLVRGIMLEEDFYRLLNVDAVVDKVKQKEMPEGFYRGVRKQILLNNFHLTSDKNLSVISQPLLNLALDKGEVNDALEIARYMTRNGTLQELEALLKSKVFLPPADVQKHLKGILVQAIVSGKKEKVEKILDYFRENQPDVLNDLIKNESFINTIINIPIVTPEREAPKTYLINSFNVLAFNNAVTKQHPSNVLNQVMATKDGRLLSRILAIPQIREQAANNANELYQQILRLDVHSMLQAVLSVPEIRAIAAPSELGRQAQFNEGAMTALSAEQLAALNFLKKKYAKEFSDKTREEHLLAIRQYFELKASNKGLPLFDFDEKSDLKEERKRMERNAELVKLFPPLDLNPQSNVPHEERLKRNQEMIRASGLTEKEVTANLQRMLLDPDHAALRYLFYKPNPYYTTNASQYGDIDNQAAIIDEEQEENIIYSFLSAKDPDPTIHEEGFEADSRLDIFRKVVAGIGRAHNTDEIKVNGKIINSQDKDDGLLDSPSCLQGVLSRLHQLNVGRKDYQAFIEHQLSRETLKDRIMDFLLQEFVPSILKEMSAKELTQLIAGLKNLPIYMDDISDFPAQAAAIRRLLPPQEAIEGAITRAREHFKMPETYFSTEEYQVYLAKYKERFDSLLPYIDELIKNMSMNNSINLIAMAQKQRKSFLPPAVLTEWQGRVAMLAARFDQKRVDENVSPVEPAHKKPRKDLLSTNEQVLNTELKESPNFPQRRRPVLGARFDKQKKVHFADEDVLPPVPPRNRPPRGSP